jgi:tRNA modification GTPase
VSETIFALASGAGPCAVSIIRVSGPAADSTLLALSGRLPAARVASVMALRDPQDGRLLDQALVLRFQAPASFTGEDSFELHVHGGRAVVAGVLDALGRCPGLRLASPGEFTRRAFLNGKLDLTEAEGLADLIEANTARQRDQALRFLGGRLRDRADAWRDMILQLQGRLEAAIDFADEDDVPEDVADELNPELPQLIGEIRSALDDGRRGEILRDGFTVVIAGAPNAGKSSLMNALARREVAIVSDIPGTTRDILEINLDLEGMPIALVDTAGLRPSDDLIEREGIRRARNRMAHAELVLWLVDPAADDQSQEQFEAPVLRIGTKSDLHPIDSGTKHDISVSSRTGEGLDLLLERIAREARDRTLMGEPALISNERQRTGLALALQSLQAIGQGSPVELVAEDLRIAARHLGSVVGHIGAEDVLGEIFGRFCIGK